MTIPNATLAELARLTETEAMAVIKLIGSKIGDENLFKLLGDIVEPGEGGAFDPSERFCDAMESITTAYCDAYSDIRAIWDGPHDDTSADDEADYRYGIMQDREAAE